jgi:NarL family two-component system response regulator LiaR
MSIRVVLADDQEVVRRGVRSFLEPAGIDIVAEASDGRAAERAVLLHRPDVVLLDIRLSNGDGLECLARLQEACPGIPVVIFTADESQNHLARAWALGAVCLLRKNARRQQIIASVRAAAKGEKLWPQEPFRQWTGTLSRDAADAVAHSKLSKRQLEVLRQLAFGLSNKEIALALGMGFETAKEHVATILYKLNVSDRTQAAIWAARNGLV